MLFDSLENKSKQNEQKLRALKLENERLDKEIEHFFQASGITQEELAKYAQDPSNFTKNEWEEIERRQKALEERLQRDLSAIRNVEETKKSFEEKKDSRNWIFCK